MKKFISLLVFCIVYYTANAQVCPYTVAVSAANYNSIKQKQGVVEIVSNQFVTVPLGFAFKVDELLVDTVSLSYLSFRYETPSKESAFFMELITSIEFKEGESSYLYFQEGAVGNRITTIEYANFESANSPGAYVNMQIQFFEKNNELAICFGPNTLPPNDPLLDGSEEIYLVLGKTYIQNEVFNHQWWNNLYDNPDNPKENFVANEDSIKKLLSFPKANTRYFFNNSLSGIEKNSKFEAHFTISNSLDNAWLLKPVAFEGNYSVNLIDVTGKILASFDKHNGNLLLANDRLAKGVYFLRIEKNNSYYTQQLIKL